MNDSTDSQHRQDPQQRELLRVCRIGRAQGLKGEVTVQIYTDEPDYRFASGSVLYTRDGATSYEVAGSRMQKNRWIIRLTGVSDRSAAEALNGTVLYGETEDADTLAGEDAWYPKDLIGLNARMAEDNAIGAPAGQSVGKVVDVIEGAQWLLKIRLASPVTDPSGNPDTKPITTALIPFVDEIVPEIDLEAGTLTLDPPGGLIPGL